jgi:hypothetical protein
MTVATGVELDHQVASGDSVGDGGGDPVRGVFLDVCLASASSTVTWWCQAIGEGDQEVDGAHTAQPRGQQDRAEAGVSQGILPTARGSPTSLGRT